MFKEKMSNNIGQPYQIPGFPNYTIDVYGNVKNIRTGKILKRGKTNGYMSVHMFLNGKQKKLLVHRLLGFTFLGLKENQMIDHVNGQKDDNRLENLRVCNGSQNQKNRKGTKGYCKLVNGGYEYWTAHIRIGDEKRIYKRFPYTEYGKQQALKWRVCMEIEHHKEFANKINPKPNN